MRELISEHWKRLVVIFLHYGKVLSVSFSVVIIITALFFLAALTIPQKLRVSFLDIGQGDAILIQTPSGKSMLIDGGPTAKVLTEFANEMSYFDHDIDVVIATHPDADHVTGLIPVLEQYDVHTILLSKAEGHTQAFEDVMKRIDDEHAAVYVAEVGDVIDFQDGVTAHILYPPQNYVPKKNDTNDASVSVVIRYGENTFLLTGDLPSNQESKLITGGLSKHVTVYKAGHHGSKYSSGEQLLSYIRPEYAVISAGKDNRYGHPNPETIGRLEKYAKEIISTIDHGTISFVTDGRMMEVETDR